MSDGPLTVAVLAGGRSSEHDVSLASGSSVHDGLEQAGHRVRFVEIGRDGVFRHDQDELVLHPGAGLLDADVAFPALHGPFGEDGTVQGLLEMLDVPYVGAGVTASALCIDKVMFKDLMGPAGLPQVDYVALREEQWRRESGQLLRRVRELDRPVFIKPSRLGSSVGIVKVAHDADLQDAIEQAFAHDPVVIAEAGAPGVEVECSVLGVPRARRQAGAPPAEASQPGEIVLTRDWYDYEAKYTPGGMELVVPARIPPAALERVRSLAVEAFALSGCEGLARVDFFVDGERVLVNELNTMPGFTATSVYAKLFEHTGIAYPQLVDRLCRLGIERHEFQRGHRF